MTWDGNITLWSTRADMNWITALAVTAVVGVLAVVIHCKRNFKGRLPPGPYSVPFLGYLPLRGENHHQVFLEAAKNYGPIVRLKFGTATVVVLNDYASVKEGLAQNGLLNRERNLFLAGTRYPSLGTLNGEAWRANRQFSLKIMHDFNWGRPAMQEMIQVEVDYLCIQLAGFKGKPISFEEYSTGSIANNMTKLFFNKRFDFDDPRRGQLMQVLSEVGRAVLARSIIIGLPEWLYNIAVHLPFTGMYRARAASQGLVKFVRPEIEEHLGTVSESFDRDFLDAYIKRTPEFNSHPKPHLTLEYAHGNALAFLTAGIRPPSGQIVWHLLNCADKVDTLQQKIQQEMDDVVGRERQPTWDNRNKMPITMACIWEMLRWRPMNPVGLPRACAEDITIDGYLIPKGTIVLANIWAVHREPKYWDDPEVFKYERFLDKNGSGLIPMPDQLMPFSIGKRSCAGQAAAVIQIFLYLTGILQKFTVLPEEGAKIDMSVHCVSLNMPQPQKLRFIPRSVF